jgi:sodium transport system permease protein
MRSRILNLIAAKELLDTLRDRRTLFVSLVLPLLLYPALLLGMTQIIGATQRNLAEEKQRVWVDGSSGSLTAFLDEAAVEPVMLKDAAVIDALRNARSDIVNPQVRDADAARADVRRLFEESRIDAALLCDEGFGERLGRFAQADATLFFDPTNEPSKTARRKVERALERLRRESRDALTERHADDAARLRFMEQPVPFKRHEVASATQKGAYSFAPMLGLLIVLMALTGAFYPAVDLAAGEKERGTMETLLVAPVTRTEIVLGKFLAIWVIAMVTALLNLSVMGLTFSKLAGMIGGGKVAFSIPAEAIFAVMLILVPTSALFSALALALSSFATSYKEGQHYLSPLFLVATPLSMVALLPNVEIGYTLALVPVANVVLLVKAMLLGGDSLGPALVATAATAVYAAIALRVAVSIFQRESVLFRGGAGASFDATTLKVARAGLPTPGQGVLAFFTVLALMFFLSRKVESAADAIGAFLLAQAAVLVPTLLLARRLKVDAKATFRLQGFAPMLLPAVVGAAGCGLVLVMGLYAPFMPVREAQGFERVIARLVETSPVVLFLLMAVLPPICEELLCRGWILSLGVLVTAALFAALHLDPVRLPPTFAAGVLLGIVLVRTGSIYAAILFHMVWNGVLASGLVFEGPAAGLVAAGPLEIGLAAVGLAASLWFLFRANAARG